MADSNAKPLSPPPPPPLVDKDDEVIERRTLRDYYIILRERLWIALPLAILVSVGWGYYKMREPQKFASTAKMLFEKPDTVVTTQAVVDQSMKSDVDLNTNIQLLGSRLLQTKVLENFTESDKRILHNAADKARKPDDPPVSSNSLPLGQVSFTPIRNSYIIQVTVVHDDPEAAATVANAYVKQFMEYLRSNAGGKNGEAIENLELAVTRLRKDSETADIKLQLYKKDKNVPSIDDNQNIIFSSLSKAISNLSEARTNLTALLQLKAQIDEMDARHGNLIEIGFIAGFGSVAALKNQLDNLTQDGLRLAERYLDQNPKIKENVASTAIAQDRFDKEIALARSSLNNRIEDAKVTLKKAEEEKIHWENENSKLQELAIEYNILKRDAEAAKTYYSSVLTRLQETKTTTAIEKLPLKRLDDALPNYTPVSPNKPAITRTCIGLGVIVFIGVAVGLSFIDDRIKSAWDVESFIGANLLGIIPDLGSVKDGEKYSLLLENKQAPGVEAFLSVYSSIKIHSKLDFPKSILVTSTIPGEGKTLISCNVAGSFARHGKKTLLIDCDLRRPMLHRHFKQQNNTGLITWFENGAALEGDLATNPSLGVIKIGENLSLLCSGGRSKSPTELLESPVFGQLLERLKREFDLVIVDSPPLGAVTDSLLIAERIDEVVYVCRFNRAYRKHIRLYMRALRNGKNEILGVVLNGLSPRRIEYYSNYRYYRSYKKYYGSQT